MEYAIDSCNLVSFCVPKYWYYSNSIKSRIVSTNISNLIARILFLGVHVKYANLGGLCQLEMIIVYWLCLVEEKSSWNNHLYYEIVIKWNKKIIIIKLKRFFRILTNFQGRD